MDSISSSMHKLSLNAVGAEDSSSPRSVSVSPTSDSGAKASKVQLLQEQIFALKRFLFSPKNQKSIRIRDKFVHGIAVREEVPFQEFYSHLFQKLNVMEAQLKKLAS